MRMDTRAKLKTAIIEW